jgi:uncharacterized protein YndB with AHSA1/START domain
MALVLSLAGVVDLSTTKEIRKTVVVDAPPHSVWSAWTTVDGVKTFFAPGAIIELRAGGEYSILFNPDNAPGERGAEGMRILEIEPLARLRFEWNGPPSLPEVRAARMRVTVSLEPLNDGRTRVELVHDRWQEGEQWRQAYDYFVSAWDLVLDRLQIRFQEGPIDWARPYGRRGGGEPSGAAPGQAPGTSAGSLVPTRFDSYYAVFIWQDGSLEGVDPAAFSRVKDEHHLFNHTLMTSGEVLTPARFQAAANGSPVAMVFYRGDLPLDIVRELAGRDPIVAAGYMRFTIRKFDVPRGRLRGYLSGE